MLYGQQKFVIEYGLHSHDTQASHAVANVSISGYVVAAYSLDTVKASRPRSESPGLGSRKVNFRPFLGTCAYGVFKAILASIRASLTSTLQARFATWLDMSGKNIGFGRTRLSHDLRSSHECVYDIEYTFCSRPCGNPKL